MRVINFVQVFFILVKVRRNYRSNEKKAVPVGPVEVIECRVSPKECPDWSNMIERTIASSRPGSVSASWNIWRRSSSVRDLVRHFATARPGRLAGMSCDESISLRKRVVVGGLTKPREDCCIHVNCKLPCTKIRVLTHIPSQLRVGSVWKEYEHVLGVGPSPRQPLFTLHLLPTENHARTRPVPIDGGHLGIVPPRVQFRALRVARDGVEGPSSWVGHDSIDDLRAATRNFELHRWSLAEASCLDQCCTQGGRRGRRPAMAVCVWVSACRYLGGVD